MIKIKFNSTKTMARYNGKYSFDDGEEKYIPEDEAIRLVKDFPRNFTEVENSPAGKSVKEPKNKAVLRSKDK